MKITTQHFMIPVIAVALGISACSDKNSDKNKVTEPAEQTTTTATTSSPTTATTTTTSNEGNWKLKADQLSSANAQDIKADLKELNTVINSANSKGVALKEELKNAAQDPSKVQEIVAKTQKIQDDIQQGILSLNLKSSEVQNLRVQMLENLSTATQLQNLSKQPGFNLAAPTDEFKHLSQQSLAQQQKIGDTLNELNKKYG